MYRHLSSSILQPRAACMEMAITNQEGVALIHPTHPQPNPTQRKMLLTSASATTRHNLSKSMSDPRPRGQILRTLTRSHHRAALHVRRTTRRRRRRRRNTTRRREIRYMFDAHFILSTFAGASAGIPSLPPSLPSSRGCEVVGWRGLEWRWMSFLFLFLLNGHFVFGFGFLRPGDGGWGLHACMHA